MDTIASDSLLNFIKKIINIPKVEVVSYHFITDNELLINLENISGNSICPHCGNISTNIHQYHWYRVR